MPCHTRSAESVSTSSFPYLRFARLHGLDYGTVLRAAEYLYKGRGLSEVHANQFEREVDKLSMGNVAALGHVISHEYDRRSAVSNGARFGA
jgi:hypothetical protein